MYNDRISWSLNQFELNISSYTQARPSNLIQSSIISSQLLQVRQWGHCLLES